MGGDWYCFFKELVRSSLGTGFGEIRFTFGSGSGMGRSDSYGGACFLYSLVVNKN